MSGLHQQIEDTITRLYHAQVAYREALAAAAQAEAEYKKTKAVIYMSLVEGTIKDKEAKADEDCHDLYLAKLQADATAVFCKQVLENLRAVISARQSILSAEARGHFVQDTMKQT